jgi:hypothetical protein
MKMLEIEGEINRQPASVSPCVIGSSAQRYIVVAFVGDKLHDQIVASERAIGYGLASIKKPQLKQRTGVREDNVDGD